MPAEITILVRSSLIEELEQLRDAVRQLAEPLTEQLLWHKPVEPGNSIGHLILHLTGNLNHFVGAQLGKTGYVREREREFTEHEHPGKMELLGKLDEAVGIFRRVVENSSAEELAAPHPETRFGTVLKALVHLTTHFALHRGQMSYIVRLLETERPQTAR
ncbi:MAG TPA: DinB family protein [Isosphaeraceae bacterium]|nr:DinB family protein [Isosphaeraceae bacterium]